MAGQLSEGKKLKLLCRAFIFAAVFGGLALPALAASNGAVKFLQKIDRQLCANFRSLKCTRGKRSKAAAPKPSAKTEKPVVVPKVVEPPIIPKPTLKSEMPVPSKVAAVMPRLKVLPAPPAERVALPLKPPEKVIEKLPVDASCYAALTAKGVDFAAVPQPSTSPNCNVQQPVQLKSLRMSGVDLQMPDHPILNCAFALHFVAWLQELGGPAATAKEGFALTKFYTGPGFVCRGRNGDISSKISEHGFGNAVDVERITFSDGQMFLVHDAPDSSSKAYETLKAMRASACTRFSTVLGPGSNAAHREHFHFDLGVHGKSGTYKICE